MKLRDYQKDLGRETQRALVHHRQVMMQLATGAGKTAIAGWMAQGLAEARDLAKRPVVALYLIHRRELAEQTCRTLERFGLGELVGRIQPGHPEVRYRPFQVGSIPTMRRRLDSLKQWLDPKVVIVDEAHHCRAETWELVMDAFPNAYRLGMTATPARLDGKGLGKHFKKITFGPEIGWLVDNGYLAPMRLFGVDPAIDLKKLRRNSAEFSMKAADSLVTGPVIAHSIKNWRRRAEGTQTIHYAVTVRHSLDFTERMNALGYPTEHIDGKTPDGQRDATLERFDRGITMCVSNVDILTEGYDCPECRTVLMARPTKSTVFYRQAAGRGMRPKADGGHGNLIDTAGNLMRHGPPDDFIEWTLADGVKVERAAGERPVHRMCSECNLFYPAAKRECPFCGHVPEGKTVEEVDVGLIDWGTTGSRGKSPKAQGRALNQRVIDTGGDLEELEKIRLEYGFGEDRLQRWLTLFPAIWEAQRRKS